MEQRLRSNPSNEGCTAGRQEREGAGDGDVYVRVACITVNVTRSKQRALDKVCQVTGEWACRLFNALGPSDQGITVYEHGVLMHAWAGAPTPECFAGWLGPAVRGHASSSGRAS